MLGGGHNHGQLIKAYFRLIGSYRHHHKHAPISIIRKQRSTSSRRLCRNGYMLGRNMGRDWARLESSSRGGKGRNHDKNLKCAKAYFKKRRRVFHLCGLKGLEAGYKHYWAQRKSRKLRGHAGA